jgi:hypothetical protein
MRPIREAHVFESFMALTAWLRDHFDHRNNNVIQDIPGDR